MGRDRRRTFRIEWISPASIEPGDGRERLNCVVQNLSNGGARIACADPLPQEFILRLTPGKGRPRACRIVWQRGHEVGVQFTDTVPPEVTPKRRPTVEPVA